MKWRWLFLLMLSFGVWNAWQGRALQRAPGVLVDAVPLQVELPSGMPSIEHAGYRITPLQAFSLEARVLSTERYRFDRQADLSPVDLALGWGPMSDSTVLSGIKISQSGRFYFWHVDHFPVPRRDIETNSANMHMIPATPSIERALKSVRPGQLVKLAGYLVEARASDGWSWRSSLTRDDTGPGACELVWLTDLDVR